MAIRLNFDENGEVVSSSVKAKPGEAVERCCCGIDCEFFRVEQLDDDGIKYEIWHCEAVGKTVFDILRTDKHCPRKRWFSNTPRHVENRPTTDDQAMLGGHGDNGD